MTPDLTNPHGIAAMFVVPQDPRSHGMNYILDTDGNGLLSKNTSGAAEWIAFDALPSGVDIATVADWTPWTIYLQDGTWYFRGHVGAAWETAAVGNESTEAAPFVPQQPPTDLLPQVS